MITESDIESAIVIQLVSLGWQPSHRERQRDVFRQSPKTEEEKRKLGRLRPDFVLYADDDSNQATVVIEAKKPNETLEVGLEQGRKYAALLGAQIVVATDGYRLKTWHMTRQSPLFYNDREVDELFPKEIARHFTHTPIYNSFSKREAITKKDLIAKFKNANDILRAEGLDAGIVRFSEFANLMFLKLQLEGGEREISGHTWNNIENKRGTALLSAVKAMFASLRREHPQLFQETKIKTPAQLEKLVDILSSFQLSTIRDDIKGMAFESFIHSYTQGLKNDLGQYFTPRHVIKLMVDYLRPQLGEKIYDPFCGTGGMLIESFRYIQQHTPNDNKKRNILCQETVYGRDNSSVARIAMMNMIMFGDGHSNVEQGDSYRAFAGKKYDVVIANIPFSQRTEFTDGYPVAPTTSEKNGDSIGVQHCLASLADKPSARAAIIVPIGFVYKKELRNEREYIARNFHLEQIVELTPKCFNPYTEQQTAILMLRRKRKTGGKTVYYRVKNDGFSQDGYRVPISGYNDIDKVMEKEGGKDIEINDQDGWKYKKIEFIVRKGEKRLGELADIRSGDSISPKTMLKYTNGGKHPIIMVADLASQHIDCYLDEIGAKINDVALEEKKPRLYPKKTIVIPTSGKAALLNHRAMLGEAAYLSATVTGITAKEGIIHPYYLFYWLLRWDTEEATYDLGYPGLSVDILKKVSIPLLTESKRQRIVDEITALVNLQKKLKKQHRFIMGNTEAIT